MKTTIAVCSAAIMLFAAVSNACADIIAGPITNPANGHDYYLLSPNSWTISEAEAESLGGTLAVIKNTNDESWVYFTFAAYGGVNRTLWIGLHRNFSNIFVWVNGEPTNYFNWGSGQPDNAGGTENSVELCAPDNTNLHGTWNDRDGAALNWGVVELPGKANELSLTKAESALIGNWYEGGNVERPCWITATDNALFVIPNNKFAARVGLCADGTLFASNFQGGWPMGMPRFGGSMPDSNFQTGMHGEIIKDKILWSNGTWWSQKPVEYITEEESSNKITPVIIPN
ncbi:MAG: C-type lectin domain-containing protein [Verrucomicrobiota bacterium]|jgi:hypothetical protein